MKKVVIACPSDDQYSETFIRDHIDQIDGVCGVLSGGFLPKFWNGKNIFLGLETIVLNILSRLQRSPSLHSILDEYRIARVARLLKREKVSVVLAEYGPTGVSLAKICEKAGCACVVHFHGQDIFSEPMVGKYKHAYREMFKKVSGVVVGTPQMMMTAQKLGATPSILYLNPCGVESARFETASPSENAKTFVFVGRFIEKKAPFLTVLAFAECTREEPNAKLVMIGDGPLLSGCRQLVRALGIQENVEFTGFLDHAQVRKWLRSARAFVQHSVTAPDGDAEGTAISVLEAAASGLPVIATRHGGIIYSMVHEETGFLVNEYDSRGMAAAMILLCRNDTLADSLGQSGQTRIKQKYEMRDRIETLNEILDKAAFGVRNLHARLDRSKKHV